jgi:hypothetical protein
VVQNYKSLRAMVLSGFIFALAGCTQPVTFPVVQPGTPTPPVVIKQTPKPTVLNPPVKYSEWPAGWVPRTTQRDWSAIIIHHSATESGNMAKFDQEHRDKGWEGVGYDFVIGNGNGSDDGEVEVTFRWTKQMQGAHTGGTPNNWANEEGIGICLVGNFDETVPTARQMQSLVKLVRFLQDRYDIPNSRIYGHGSTPGGHKTDCPGKNFPMARFKNSL